MSWVGTRTILTATWVGSRYHPRSSRRDRCRSASEGAAGRYSVVPGQATAYLVGMLHILDARQRAQDQLGAQFDLRAFHRVVLTNGGIPLALLDDVVDNWIAEQLATP